MRKAAALLLFLLPLLAGCLGDGDADGPADSPEVDDSPVPDGNPAPPVEADTTPKLPDAIQWTSCFGAYTEFYWPGFANPAPPFDGWAERDLPFLPTEIRHMLFECERFGFDAIERGPIQFLLEVTNDRRPPDGCLALEPEADVLNFIGLWTSDAEVADALRAEGLPAGVGSFSMSVENGPPIHYHGEWTIDGNSAYLDAYQEAADASTLLGASPWRIFWANELGGVSAIEFGHEVTATPLQPERLVTGEFAAPLAMTGPYAGTGYHFSAGDFGGAITRFEDVACTQPAS